MISFQDFRRLWGGALDCASLESYIAEEGGSVPLDDAAAAIMLLEMVYAMAHGEAKTLRAVSGLTQREMARVYGVPESTINKWDSRINQPPEWVRVLLGYAILCDKMEETPWQTA